MLQGESAKLLIMLYLSTWFYVIYTASCFWFWQPNDWITCTFQVLELNLVKDVKDSRKSICKYTAGKKKTRENVALMLNVLGDLETKNMEKEKRWFGGGSYPRA